MKISLAMPRMVRLHMTHTQQEAKGELILLDRSTLHQVLAWSGIDISCLHSVVCTGLFPTA